MINYIIATLALIITLFFSYNFKEILKKIKEGKNINKLSLLATSTLIIHFLCLAVYFWLDIKLLVLLSEFYTLICLMYLLKRNKGAK